VTGPTFTTEQLPGGDIVATTTDPRLRGVCWWWTPDTGQVEWGLSAGAPVNVCNVWDYATGRCSLAPTPQALADYLADRYADDDEITALVDELSHS